MCRFFASQKKLTAVYTLTGKPVEKYANVAFTAPVAYAAQIISNQKLKSRYTSALTEKMSGENYYSDTIQMLTLLTSGSIGKD